MEVTLGRGQLRVPHPTFQRGGVELAHDEGPEAMAQVMEAQQAQPGGLLLADLPLAVVFDIWIANCDRWSRNLLL